MIKLDSAQSRQINLDLLLYFDEICRKNHIRYSLTGGTLLGAVRHGGFIPWDDDVDVFMTRPEFDRLDKVFPREGRFVWQSRSRIPRYEYVYGRVMDSRTIIMEAGGLPSEGKGVFLDVCVVDGLPDNKLLRKAHITYMKYLYKGRRAVITDSSQADYYEKGLAHRIIKDTLNRTTDLEFWQKRMEKAMKRYPFDGGRYVGNFCSQYGAREMLHRKAFSSYQEMTFEGHSFMVCRGWEEYLKNIYGNYMQLPPPEKRVSNHGGDSVWLMEEGETREECIRQYRSQKTDSGKGQEKV